MTKRTLVVLADLGIEPPRRAAADAADPDGWMASIAPTGDLPGPGSAKVHCAWRTAADFRPAAIKALAPTATPAELDRMVQDPRFQRVESVWRGVRHLLAHAGKSVELEILAVSRNTLAATLRDSVIDPIRRGTREAPVLLLADFDFTHQAGDLAELAELAEMAAELNAPLVAGASPAFFGLRHFAHVAALPDPHAPLSDAAHAPWREFQATDGARWTCLTLGRYLQREPHSDAEPLGWTETVAEAKPETYLWGRGIWIVGAAVARSLESHGHPLDVAGRGALFTEMPTRAYPQTANQPVALATEAPLPEMRVSELAWAGFTPVAAVLRAASVLLPMVVTTSRLRPGKLTLEGTLAYQLLAATLAQALEEAIAEGLYATTAEQSLRTSIGRALGSIAKEMPDSAIHVQIVPPADEPGARLQARVEVRPGITLEGKTPEFIFEVPVRAA